MTSRLRTLARRCVAPELPDDGGPQSDVGPLIKGGADTQIQCQRAGFEIGAEHQLVAATALERSFELESDGVVLFKPAARSERIAPFGTLVGIDLAFDPDVRSVLPLARFVTDDCSGLGDIGFIAVAGDLVFHAYADGQWSRA